MTIEAALNQFFGRVPLLEASPIPEVGYIPLDDLLRPEDSDAHHYLPAYPDTAVPEEAALPYLTYTVQVGEFEATPVSLTVNIWCRSTDEGLPNAYARELGKLIPRGGVLVSCDGGGMWILRGAPWCQSLVDSADSGIKRRYFNVTVEFLTEN